MAKGLVVKKLAIHFDSQLFTSQITEEYTAKHPKMAQYLEKAKAKPMMTTTQTDIERFIWRNIICQFGILHSIITDNSPQFVGKYLMKFFQKFGIKQYMSTPRYPQGNGQAESSNKTILDCFKKSLTDKKGKWPDKLPRCLWAYRTTKRQATGETSFSLAFGSKAIIHPNIIVPSISTLLPSIEQNSKEMTTSLDLAEEKRE
ncbi:uncharacterized protein [Pyrus communis]|uniref:uncharacterized protein n=1 Tax=Pyrus communis TaxID=23211 RepID=UPI0035C03DBC